MNNGSNIQTYTTSKLAGSQCSNTSGGTTPCRGPRFHRKYPRGDAICIDFLSIYNSVSSKLPSSIEVEVIFFSKHQARCCLVSVSAQNEDPSSHIAKAIATVTTSHLTLNIKALKKTYLTWLAIPR